MRNILISFIIITGLFSGLPARGQVKIRKMLSETEINQYQSSHLVLIDFWATWCAPCINIGKQLEVTQETFKDHLSIISLSNESEPVVQKFIDKHHPKLTIALDNDNRTFDFYQVNRSLPYAVLLDQRGRTLWQGHPADLSNAMLARFIRENKDFSGWDTSLFIEVAREDEILHAPPSDMDQFSVKRTSSEESRFLVSAEGVEFQGRVSRLFSEVLKRSRHDIRVANDPVVEVRIGALQWQKGPEYVVNRILEELNMSWHFVSEGTKFYQLTVRYPGLLWDDHQINLGSYDGACLTGDESITVDNATVREFSFRFSEVMDYPVYTDYDSPELHDWLVHYKFFDLTKAQLENDFGIGIELKNGMREVYYFQ